MYRELFFISTALKSRFLHATIFRLHSTYICRKLNIHMKYIATIKRTIFGVTFNLKTAIYYS